MPKTRGVGPWVSVILPFGHLDLFRISDFGFRISFPSRFPWNNAPTLTLLFALAAQLTAAFLTAAEPTLPPPDLPQLLAAVAAYEPGQSLAPLRRIEDLARQSAANPELRKQLEAGLGQLLTSKATPDARRFACEQLAVVGSDASLPALAELLKNEETVGLACVALRPNPSPKASAIVRDALPRLRGDARVQLINLLGDRRDPESVNLMTELANDPDAAAAEAAIAALGNIANAPACQAIAALRRNGQPAQARAIVEAALRAAETIAAAGDRKSATAIYEDLLDASQPNNVRRGALEALLRLDEDGGEQRILKLLRGSDAVLKPVAIAGIRSLPSPDASEKFARELPRLQPPEQAWLLESLAGRDDAAARAALIAALAAENPEVRLAAIEIVGKHGNAASVPALSQALAAAKRPAERAAAEKALAGLRGGKATDAAIIAELKRATPEAKRSLIAILARRDSRAAVPVLLEETSNRAMAKPVFQALGQLAAAEDVPVLLGKLLDLKIPSAREAAADALGRALAKVEDSDRRSEFVLQAISRKTDTDTRCSLMGLLPICGGPQALAALQAARKNQDAAIRDAALRALADWPDASAWDTLAESYRQPESESYRVLALGALVRLAGEENARADAKLIERYRQLLAGARSDDDRKLILSALSGAAHPEALPLALPLVSNAAVRAEAELAVKKISEAVKARDEKK